MSTLDWVVEQVDDITPAWASGLLGEDVTEVDVARVGTGQIGTAMRLRVHTPGGWRSLLLKLPAADPGSRQMLAGAYRTELLFYDRIARTVAVRVPRAHAARFDDQTGHFVLLLEDLAPLEQGDQIAGCTPERVLDAAVNLAGLHGPRWSDPSLLRLPGITRNDAEGAATLAELYGPTVDLFVDALASRLAADDVATLRATVPHIEAWSLARQEQRFGLVHGDYRLDNLMFTPEGGSGEVAAVDWQTLSIGLPGRDLAYLVTTSLEPEARRAAERDVVAAYHARLVELGVGDHDLDECWSDYVFGQLQVPLVVTFGCAYGTRTERGDEMFAAMTRRSGAAIRDLGVLASLSS
ncbi:phosphotransferase family protein [Nocardioides acrostichi]|uniref:Phosphotransferase n=1 Tax=Nocardioides acrostichi TaxID=2784339 RepID=A0A930V1V8_9ACTN|nr:phosphotransferase [Nocardioides acrostichi]MBF4162242.1 phosphotransferase [Nocardioides acrostichi]